MMPDDQRTNISAPHSLLAQGAGEPGCRPQQLLPGPGESPLAGDPMHERLVVRTRGGVVQPAFDQHFAGRLWEGTVFHVVMSSCRHVVRGNGLQPQNWK